MLLLDADDPSSVKESAKKVGSLLGNNGLNLLVNNAGIVANGTIQNSRVDDMKNTVNTNVIGPLLIIRVMYKASLRALIQQLVFCHCGLQARGFHYCVTRTQVIKMIVFGEELVTGCARICHMEWARYANVMLRH